MPLVNSALNWDNVVKSILWLSMLMAISLQVQWDFAIKGQIIRIGLSDFIVPFALLYVGYLRYTFKIDLNTDFKQFLLWGFACLALLIISTSMT